jgi:N-acetylglucosaminyl-diphospho-decaprenol L-rhamnosyltransferase
MELSIICVNWNSLEYLRECVRSVYAETKGIDFEIIVVDNASPEGGIDTLRDEFPQIKIVKSPDNLGFARANNLGFQDSSGQYVLLLNPDTRLAGPAINQLLNAIKSLPDAGIVGGKLLNSDLSVQTQAIQKFPTILNQLLNIEALRLRWPRCPLWALGPLFEKNELPVRVDVIPGACMLMRREVFAKVGMFSDDYFMYGEDLDLNYKVKLIGLSSYYVGEAEIIHHGGRSSSRQKVSQWSTVMKYKAMLCFYRKSRGKLYGSCYRAAMASSAVGRLILLGLMFPVGDREAIRWTAAKWSTILKWAIGMERLGVS